MLCKLIGTIDAVNRRVGQAAAWLGLALVAAQFTVVVLRYVFAIGFVWLQESVLYFYGMLFLLGAGYTLLADGHVRVDVLYRSASARAKALIDAAGAVLLLLPVCGLVFWTSWDYVLSAWNVAESSGEALGLPFAFAYKTLIWIFAALLGAQGVSLALKSVGLLSGAVGRSGEPPQ
jgi:TRAP-type mannitol/chloroaromatic compound transport system permease small subunit